MNPGIPEKSYKYSTPHLNDSLFLNTLRLESIPALDSYFNLKCLYLNNNSLTEISGLNCLKKLRTLHLNNNSITKISGLDQLKDLRVLDLSCNRICRIENIQMLENLNILNLENNAISLLDEQQGEQLLALSSLTQLNLAHNALPSIDPEFFSKYCVILKCLYLQGNGGRPPLSLRDELIQGMQNLVFLDNKPVNKEVIKEDPIDPVRAELLTERRNAILTRIEAERSFNQVTQNVEMNLDSYADRIRREYANRQNITDEDNTSTVDKASSEGSDVESENSSLLCN
jgi:Leucine Rich repeats (2 copies)